MATLLFLAVVVIFFAVLGRSATPPLERLPWTRWTLSDLLRNAAVGLRCLDELHRRQQHRVDAHLGKVPPRRPDL